MQENLNMPSPENGRHEIEAPNEFDSLRDPLRAWLAHDTPIIVTRVHADLRSEFDVPDDELDIDFEVTWPIFEAWRVVEAVRDEMTPTSLEINDNSWLEVLGYRDDPNYRNALLDKFNTELLREKVLAGTGIDLQTPFYTEQTARTIYAMISELYYQTYTAA